MTPTYDDPNCQPCMREGVVMYEEDRINWCVAHQDMWWQWQHELQPRVLRRNHPRCLICHHKPRLLFRYVNKDAWYCRWGHDVSGIDLYVARKMEGQRATVRV